MDLSKAVSINADYRTKTSINWETILFAEVVFIDKTHPSAPPIVYQLKSSLLADSPPPLVKSTAFSLSSDNFVLLGELGAIDKKKKQILLSSKNTVSYSYLVIASGSKPVYTEFASGLQSLIEALKVKPGIADSFDPYKKTTGLKAHPMHSSTPNTNEDSPNIEKIVRSQIAAAVCKTVAIDLNTINKRLYEFQT